MRRLGGVIIRLTRVRDDHLTDGEMASAISGAGEVPGSSGHCQAWNDRGRHLLQDHLRHRGPHRGAGASRSPTAVVIVGALALAACAPSLAQVSNEPVLEPPPDGTEVHRSHQRGTWPGLSPTRLTIVYAVPQSAEEISIWYGSNFKSIYEFTPEPSEGEARDSLLGDNPETGNRILIFFFDEEGDYGRRELPAEALDKAPPGTGSFVEVSSARG